jgi:hypothetical protein
VNVLEEKLISYKQFKSHRKPTTQEASDQEEEVGNEEEDEFRFRSGKETLDSQNSNSNLRQLKFEIEIVLK